MANIFQNLPLTPPPGFFLTNEKNMIWFIWNNRRSRFRLSSLHLSYDRGGLKYPNFQFYYWAMQLRTMMFYYTNHSPHWIEKVKG